MEELDINKLRNQAQSVVKHQDENSSSVWGRNLSQKRIEIKQEHLDVMETELASKLLDIEPEQTLEKPTTAEDAVQGLGGYKLDTGKPRWELAPFDAFEAMVLVQTWAVDRQARGSKAYPERNWERGMAWSRVFGAMIRHAWKWWFGKMAGRATHDEESGMSHIWHAFTCAGFLVAYELRGITDFDDRPKVTPDKPDSTK